MWKLDYSYPLVRLDTEVTKIESFYEVIFSILIDVMFLD